MQQFNFNRQQALADGYTPDQINQYLSSRQQQGVSYADMQPQQAQPQQEKGNGFLDWLPLIGAVGGSFIPGLGNIAGGALGAGAGALAKNLFDKKPGVDVGDVGKEALLGGAGGVVGKGLGFIGGKVAGALGGKLSDAGTEIGIKGLRLNPSQISNFQIRHNEDIGRFLASEGALGKDSATLAEKHINPLQEQFNHIAKQSGLTVNPDTFLQNVDEHAQKLIEAGGSANKEIAQKLRNEALYIWQNDLSPANFDISKVDKLRSTFAKKVNWTDPEKATLNYAMADALRKTAIDTADEAGATGVGGIGLKDIGIKLSKYRDIQNAAIKQEALGKGKMPLGITNWLGILAGGGIGGPAGIGTGIAANAIVNSPKFLQLASRGAVKGGDALANAGAPGVGATITGRSAVQSAVRAPFSQNQGNPAMQGEILPSPESAGNTPGQGTGQDDNLRKILGTLMLSSAKTPTELAAAYNFLNPSAQQKPLNATQQQNKASADSGLRALDLIQNILQSDSNAPLKAKVPLLGQQSPYATASREAADVLTRLRTGAALNESEQKFYQSQLPQPFDYPDTIAYKLNLFRQLFNSIANGQNPVGETPASMMQ